MDANNRGRASTNRQKYRPPQQRPTGPGPRNANNNTSHQRPLGTDRSAAQRRMNTRPQHHNDYGISITKIEEIFKKLDSKELLTGSMDLLIAVQVESFFKRLDNLWPEVESQQKFLRVIVAVASTTQADLVTLTHEFMIKVLRSKFIDTIIDKHINQMAFNPQKRTALYAMMAEDFVTLFLISLEMLPSIMEDHIAKITQVIMILKLEKIRRGNEFPTAKTFEQIGRLEQTLDVFYTAKEAQQIKKNSENTAGSSMQFEGSHGAPPENFRKLSVIPTRMDVIHTGHVYLRAAKKEGQYDDDEHYLDVQFRLLREDLIRPLRDGIADYRKGGTQNTDLFVYKHVRFSEGELHKQSGELLHFAILELRRRMRMDRRLTYGSLVCVSADDFVRNFLFAVVIERDELQTKGIVGLKFENQTVLNPNIEYSIVESPAFYEAYKHVMLALQSIRPGEHVPFSQYLVQAQTHPAMPAYVLRNAEQALDFACLLKEEFRDTLPTTKCVVRLLSTHLRPEHFNMDQSQFDAFCYALNSELAVVQGPPGTGKTWLGLRIVEVLFANSRFWLYKDDVPDDIMLLDSDYENYLDEHGMTREQFLGRQGMDTCPMLVVCYTNHALDQFLEGILHFLPDGIVRVGGRCKNQKLEPFMLNNIRYSTKVWTNSTIKYQFYECKDRIQMLTGHLAEMADSMKSLENRLASPEVFKKTECNDKQKQFIRDGRSNKGLMFYWLTYGCYYPMNILLIMDLMKMGISELYAKMAYFIFAFKEGNYPNVDSTRIFTWYRSLRKWERRQYFNQPDDRIRCWPSIERVIEINREFGINHVVACEMLSSVNSTDYDRVFAYFRQQQRQQQAPLNPRDNQERYEGGYNAGMVVGEGNLLQDDYEDREMDDRRLIDVLNVFVHENKEKKPKKDPTAWYACDRQRMNLFYEHITSTMPMDEEEAMEQIDLPTMALHNRWRLYQFWVRKELERRKVENVRMQNEYRQLLKRFEELRSMGDIGLFRQAKVIGMTTTGAAKHQATLRALKPRIVVIEEAAEVLEAHLVTSLTEACEHVILIGDHQQLRPNPAVYELARRYNLDISLFERLVNNGFEFKTLINQHRMRPEISRVLMPHFYKNLQDDPSVSLYEHVRGMQKDLYFINHSNPEKNTQDSKSHSNIFESQFAVKLAKYLLQQEYRPQQITILCAYMEQFFDVRNEMRHQGVDTEGLRIENVDNYQGEESDIIILSLVRSNNPQKKIGFLNIPNRVCVALSRAKIGFYAIGNFDFLAENCEMWRDICDSVVTASAKSNSLPIKCQVHGNQQEICSGAEFVTKAPEGGCREVCNYRMECGHTCMKPCHPADREHTQVRCTKDCARTCPSEYKHPCRKRCYEYCGDCQIEVEKHLPCGHSTFTQCHIEIDRIKCQIDVMKTLPCKHTKSAFCYLPPNQIKCDEPCVKILQKCGHPCASRCSQPCTVNCKVKVTRQLQCGHQKTMACSRDVYSVRCNQPVEKEWPICGHRSLVECHTDVNTTLCPTPCRKELACGDLCEGTCGRCRNGRLHIDCDKECKRILICGHVCGSKCAKVCPPCTKNCETQCGHSQCSRMLIEGEKEQKKVRKIGQGKNARNCGDPCPPCAEECLNRCKHRQCSKRCHEECNVPPCTRPCDKLLECSPEPLKDGYQGPLDRPHRCVGVCGDECLEECRICDPEKFVGDTRIVPCAYFAADEEADDNCFVQLKDCGHIFEVNDLDQFVRSKAGALEATNEEDNMEMDENAEREPTDTAVEIIQIKCPICGIPIRRSHRYLTVLNKRSADIEQIKLQIRGEPKRIMDQEWKKEREQIDKALVDRRGFLFSDLSALAAAFKKISGTEVTVGWREMARNIFKIASELKKRAEKIGQDFPKPKTMLQSIQAGKPRPPCLNSLLVSYRIKSFSEFLLDDLKCLLARLSTDIRTISEATLHQVTNEVARFDFMFNLFKWMNKWIAGGRDIDAIGTRLLERILNILFGPEEFKAKPKDDAAQLFADLTKHHPVGGLDVTKEEMIQINQALSGSITKWYKCSKGHFYGIGDCGRAMQKSQCPECNETIGGEHHALVETSREASELNALGGRANVFHNPFIVRYH